MKFYKNFKLNSKIKLIAIGICIAVMVLVAVNYIKINAAFPEAQELFTPVKKPWKLKDLELNLRKVNLWIIRSRQ